MKLAKFAVVPVSIPWVIPVTVTLPVLVSVKGCEGSRAQATTPRPVPGQLRVCVTVQLAGVNVTVFTAATPVPLSVTVAGVTVAPVNATVKLPVAGPVAVGENTTPMVQFAPLASVAPQLPGAVVDRENGDAFGKVNVPPASAVFPVFVTVTF